MTGQGSPEVLQLFDAAGISLAAHEAVYLQ
jgi:hypothetical protein